MNNSLGFLSLFVASLAILIPITDWISNISDIFNLIPYVITLGIIVFIFKDGLYLKTEYDNHNKKIKYLIFIIETQIKNKEVSNEPNSMETPL